MCLTNEALFLFLSLFPASLIDASPDRIIFKAEMRDAVWERRGERWCTQAPQIDAAIRFGQGTEV